MLSRVADAVVVIVSEVQSWFLAFAKKIIFAAEIRVMLVFTENL